MPLRVSSDTGVIIVDHGSTRDEANALIFDVARLFRTATGAAIVEVAHMELAEPTIAQAFARCVEQGAHNIVVHPYFLAPGRHSTSDIPRIAAEAAAAYPHLQYSITEPLGLDSRLIDVIADRVGSALTEGDRRSP